MKINIKNIYSIKYTLARPKSRYLCIFKLKNSMSVLELSKISFGFLRIDSKESCIGLTNLSLDFYTTKNNSKRFSCGE